MISGRPWSLAGIVGFCIIVLLNADSSLGGIVDSPHDFSGQGWAENQICVPCHTPHNAYTFSADADGSNEFAPLWNHTSTTAFFTLYASPTGTMDVVVNQPGSVSKVCLSCHDGTVAIDSFGGKIGSTFITGTADIGTDLMNDHPIGILWNHQTAGANCTNCHPFVWDPDLGAFISLKPNTPMFNSRVECPSCHDPHNSFNFPFMLRVQKAGSTVCFSCHGDK